MTPLSGKMAVLCKGAEYTAVIFAGAFTIFKLYWREETQGDSLVMPVFMVTSQRLIVNNSLS